MSHYVPSITDARKSARWEGHQWPDFHTKCHKNLVPNILGGDGEQTRGLLLYKGKQSKTLTRTDEKPYFCFILIVIQYQHGAKEHNN
jgi:hypothetical protein